MNELPATGDSQTEYFSHYDADFTTKNFRLEPPTRFGSRYLPELKNSRVTTCFLDSTVVEIQTRGSRVTALRVHSTGKEFSVRAKVFVLALGGIENARLLLHSDREHSRGIGNQSDFVGRCFADHLGITIGRVLASEQAPYVPQNVNGIQILPHLSLTDELLVQHQLINFGIIFLNVQSRAIPLMGVDYLSAPLFSREWEGSPRTRLYHLLVRLEPLPDPESRLSLSRQKDSYGVRRVRLDWKVHGLEFECLERILDLVARKIGAANLGRVLQIFQNRLIDREILGTYQSHHLGTTRMARNPDQGVVNVDGKVHSMENLYIAGSSVFPTFGFANPTLTIVALYGSIGFPSTIPIGFHLLTEMQTPASLIQTTRNSAALRSPYCSRRRFLGAITVTSLSLLPGCSSQETTTTFCRLLMEASRELALSPVIGEAYLRKDDSEKEVEKICAVLRERLAIYPWSIFWLDSDRLLDELRRAVEEDFAAEESICRVRGWYLSQTECRLAALAHLLRERLAREATHQAANSPEPVGRLVQILFLPETGRPGEEISVQVEGFAGKAIDVYWEHHIAGASSYDTGVSWELVLAQ